MTIFTIDANDRKSKQFAFVSDSQLCAFLYENSVFNSNWSVLNRDYTIVYRAASDGSFRQYMVWDNNARKQVNIYQDASHWEDGLTWLA